MSADNFYMIRKHPNGGFCLDMGFDSDDNYGSCPVSEKLRSWPTLDEVIAEWNEHQDGRYWSEYGMSVHQECFDVHSVSDKGEIDVFEKAIADVEAILSGDVETYCCKETIAPGAFGATDKKIPLTWNWDYQRVVGSATVHSDGSLTLTIVDPELLEWLKKDQYDLRRMTVSNFPAKEATRVDL